MQAWNTNLEMDDELKENMMLPLPAYFKICFSFYLFLFLVRFFSCNVKRNSLFYIIIISNYPLAQSM